MNKTAMNIGLRITYKSFCGCMFLFLLSKYLGVQLQDFIFTLQEIDKWFFKVLITF